MKTQTRSCRLFVGSICSIALLIGCAGEPNAPSRPRYASIVAVEPWTYPKSTARVVRSHHYAIHTTIADDAFLDKLSELMESALHQYQLFTPGVRLSATPMDCYVFQRREEWADFTTIKTGDDAALYLQINRGGYTVRDWYVAYFIGDVGTYAVAAHEGWHQYVARHFKSRLPPFLEEGIATMFENVRFYSASSAPPAFDLSPKSHRADKLRHAIDSKNMWPLEKLITMHAGDVVSLPGPKIEAFYAQNWAFAEFLWDAENGKYRPALHRLLNDCATGTLFTGEARPSKRRFVDSWNPESVQPMLEHYLGMDLPQVERAYLAYCRKIAYAARVHSSMGG
jgi:hypothetical protein